jgi:hypothetical protein
LLVTERAGKIATILAVGPLLLVLSGLGGVGGAWLALHLMRLAHENFFIGPILWLTLAAGGFVVGGAITLALLFLLCLPLAHRLGWGQEPTG